MKTVRTRVKTALRRNSTVPVPPVPSKPPAVSTPASSLKGREKEGGASLPSVLPATPQEKDDPPSLNLGHPTDSPVVEKQTVQPESESPNIAGLKFTGDEPEQVHVPPQTVPIKDDSRRSTPRKRIKSVPRVSSDNMLPSPSIASRIQTVLPPPDQAADEVKFVSPVDPEYLIDDIHADEPQLLDQPAPTSSAFVDVDLTPKEFPSSLPPLHEVLTNHVQLKRLDSTVDIPRIVSLHETVDEEKPLLAPSMLSADVDDILDSVWPLSTPSFPSLGWTEHVLPSSAYYYSHAATRTVTDIDLRNEKKLAAVRSYLKSQRSAQTSDEDGDSTFPIRLGSEARIEEGVDLWLRDANPGFLSKDKSEWQFMPMRNWVLHATRAVTFDPPSERGAYHQVDDSSDEDRLDLESRYWLYMSTHPAHASLPQTAYDEALEVVVWCYADRVLRTPQPFSIDPPFSQKECVDYLDLLKNVAAPMSPAPSSAARTRLVAQILLRYTEWRQKYIVRLNKKHGESTSKIVEVKLEKVEHAIPFRKTLLHFVKAILCLGIPYLFESRRSESTEVSSSRQVDEEEQRDEQNSRTGDARLGSAQIVAALLLSASVTFLALPDLHGTSRGAALISSLCSSASLVSYVITLNARTNRRGNTSSPSKNSILPALPLVLLAYSLCAFVAGIIAYPLEGTVAPGRAGGGLGRSTGWIVVGVSIALAAVLAWSAALSRKGT